LFSVVKFLKSVVTEVFFNCCLYNIDISQGSVATHLRRDGIFSDYKFSPDSDNEKTLKIS